MKKKKGQRKLLNNFQVQILTEIGQSELARYFNWGGGTALSYFYLQHRLSEDLDFFSQELIGDEIIIKAMNDLKEKLKISEIKYLKYPNRSQFFIKKANVSLKIEFIYFPFIHLQKPVKDKTFNLTVESLFDIAANKTLALYERQEPKDVYDFHYILQKKEYSLDNLIKAVSKKFGVDIDKSVIMAKISDLSDNLDKIRPFLIKKDRKTIEKIKQYFKNIGYKNFKNLITF